MSEKEAAHTILHGKGESIEIVKIGDDPHGRDEPTVYYRDLNISPTEKFYLWVKLWPADWPPLPQPPTP